MKNIWNRKFPTLIGLLIITIGTVVTTLLVKGGTVFNIKAGPDQEPKNIKVTNISDSSYAVSYLTDDQVIGTINYSTDPNNIDSVALDNRDELSQTVNKYTSHLITAKNLEPNTDYYYSITSGDKRYLDNGTPFKTKTGNVITENPSSQVPISGKVVMPDGSIPKEGLVYVTINNAQQISTLLKNDGTYTLPLNNLRNLNLDEYFKIDASTLINVDIYAERLFSSLSTSPGEISPVPLITLSGSYDFSNPVNSPTPTNSSDSEGFPAFGNISSSSGDPKILTPDSGEDLTQSQPVFEGTAQPNETIEITIHSDENIKTQIKADAKGMWEYTPDVNLSPGEHTITIVTKNKDGILKTITRSFTVFAAENEITQTPTVTLSSSLTPTLGVSPVPTLPPTGNSSVAIASIVGFIAAFSGIIVFHLTRKNSL